MTKKYNRANWTPAMDAELQRRYPNETAPAIAADFGVSRSQVYDRAKKLGLYKSREWKAQNARATNAHPAHGGRAYRFTPGHPTWNKGMHYQAGGRSVATQFKKGAPPAGTLPVGSHRITRGGTLQRKIGIEPGPNHRRWRSVHELLWIEAYGPLLAGHIVVFKKGMKTTVLEEITLERIECISLAENMRRNTVHNYGREVAKAVQLRGAISRQINQRKTA